MTINFLLKTSLISQELLDHGVTTSITITESPSYAYIEKHTDQSEIIYCVAIHLIIDWEPKH